MMKVFYEEKSKEGPYTKLFRWYIMADKSVYVLMVTYKGDHKISQLFCKLLSNVKDYKKLKKLFYLANGEVLSDPVIRKASESLNLFSLDKATHTIALNISLKHIFILETEADKK